MEEVRVFGERPTWTWRRAALAVGVAAACATLSTVLTLWATARLGHVLHSHAALAVGERPEGLWFAGHLIPFGVAAVPVVVVWPVLSRQVLSRWGSPRVRADVEE